MTASEILAEHAEGASLTVDVLAALIREGVDMRAICRRVERGRLGPPRLDRVVYLGNGFEFARYHGGRDVGAMTFIVRDEIGDPIDIAAWSPRIAKLATWCGRGALLGAENCFGFRMQEKLAIHPTPLEWLQNLCRGVVVLNGAKAADLLRRAQPLQASSYEHGQQLERLLTRPRPRIFVPTPNQRRAA
jgi:hypothetical protein